jgi:hypothetical protein
MITNLRVVFVAERTLVALVLAGHIAWTSR